MSICKKCGLKIVWRTTPGRNNIPVNVDGSDHWDICKTEQNKGKVFIPISSGVITGKEFVDPECDCIPWEGCEICQALSEFDKEAARHLQNIFREE